VAALFFLKKPSLVEARYFKSSVFGCALGYDSPLRRRQSKLTIALLFGEKTGQIT
jgi:hypothetical protein